MRSRFESFGIGQNVRIEWMNEALRLTLEKKPAEKCRKLMMCRVLDDTTKTGSRGNESALKVIGMLGAWFSPVKEMRSFVAQLLNWARNCPAEETACLHWAVFSATYPFFMEVSKIVGRLLSLQPRVTKQQILKRCEEIRGVTPTTARNLEYALWIMVNFGLLKHSDEFACYERADSLIAVSDQTALLLWKAMLHATKGGRLSATALRNSPAFFPFAMPMIFPSQFREAFDDVDTTQYVGVDEQIFLKEFAK